MSEQEHAPTEDTVAEQAEHAESGAQDAGAGAIPADDARALDEQIATLTRERDEYLDQWRRSAAEFQNFKKREERLRGERERAANARLLRRLLPVLDDLMRGAQHVPEELSGSEWAQGMLAIERKLWGVLEQEGVTRVDASPGTPFDPAIHEALISQPSEEIQADHIVQELEPGYRHHESVLRPARVIVAQ